MSLNLKRQGSSTPFNTCKARWGAPLREPPLYVCGVCAENGPNLWVCAQNLVLSPPKLTYYPTSGKGLQL